MLSRGDATTGLTPATYDTFTAVSFHAIVLEYDHMFAY
jgi:hypothetical protein